jgi:hypothetical protein
MPTRVLALTATFTSLNTPTFTQYLHLVKLDALAAAAADGGDAGSHKQALQQQQQQQPSPDAEAPLSKESPASDVPPPSQGFRESACILSQPPTFHAPWVPLRFLLEPAIAPHAAVVGRGSRIE